MATADTSSAHEASERRGPRRGKDGVPMATPKTHPLSLRLTADDVALLERLSAERDVPMAQIIREALREYGERHPPKKGARRGT